MSCQKTNIDVFPLSKNSCGTTGPTGPRGKQGAKGEKGDCCDSNCETVVAAYINGVSQLNADYLIAYARNPNLEGNLRTWTNQALASIYTTTTEYLSKECPEVDVSGPYVINEIP